MDIDIEYENICLNCKEKGFYFGYSYKTITYKGEIVLDLPHRHLNGPAIAFKYRNIPLILHSVENSHQIGAAPDKPVFAMINMKRGETISKFSYLYLTQNNKDLCASPSELPVAEPKILFFVDTYRYPGKPYILTYFAFQNETGEPLIDFNFYQFFDFDIQGQASHNQNQTHYDKKMDVIYQFHSEKGRDGSLIAGTTSTFNNHSVHYEANKPENLMISVDRVNLRDNGEFGPDDCAVALQWQNHQLKSGEMKIYPVALIFGQGEKEFLQNCKDAKEHLQKMEVKAQKSFTEPGRVQIDPKLQKMSFSVTEWCKGK